MNREQAIAASQACEGWCSAEKAGYLFDVAKEASKHKDAIAVEIGVLAGMSFLPIAAGLGNGLAFAIDPWDNRIAAEGMTGRDREWWLKHPLAKCERAFHKTMATHRIGYFTLKERSAVASTFFEDNSVSVFHVDGNHTSDGVLLDFHTAYDKLVKGGVLVVDDVGSAHWTGVDKSIPWLTERCEKIQSGENWGAWRKR